MSATATAPTGSAQIITFGTLQARAALRDVGRVLGLPFGLVDRICKLVPNNPANPVTLAQAIEMEPRLKEARDDDPSVARMIGIALQLEGLPRNASTHAAGVVIGDRPLEELVPLYRDPRALMPATQFNMKDVEKAGLVKFDFLGLSTLTMLVQAEQLVNERGTPLALAIAAARRPRRPTSCCRGPRRRACSSWNRSACATRCASCKPDCFEDIIAMVSLYRPGPMDNIPRYINVKHKLEDPSYLHPLLESILAETNGVIIYQEQVMEIAKQLAGYTLGGADLLRRAMGKKIKAEMDAQREVFVKGAVERGIAAKLADTIFDAVAKFASYGFNKSHAAAYALLAYQTGLAEGEPPGRVLRRGDDHRVRQPGEARRLSPRDAPAGHPALSARRQRLEGALPGRGRPAPAPASATRWRRSRASGAAAMDAAGRGA